MLWWSGRGRRRGPRLREQMAARAARRQYGAAAQLRDAIAAIDKGLAKQDVVQDTFVDQDVFGLHRDATTVEAVVLFVRQGKLMGRRSFHLTDQELPDEETLTAVVQQYYELGGAMVPDEVVVPLRLEAGDAIAGWLGGKRGKQVKLITPARGTRRKLIALAAKNAAASYASRSRRDADALAALVKLQQRLSLAALPRRIECFDVAHIQGAAPVASRVVFVDGVPARGEYRKFKVKTVGNDDFAAMYEVLSRRFRRMVDDDERWAAPDLLVIDGGKGQLNMAVAALEDLGLPAGFDIIALAKERDEQRPERVYRRGAKDPLRLRPHSAELFLLARIRDEAHRFANTYHRDKRRKTSLRSRLDDIPGIGPKRRQRLLRHFGSVKAIRAATLEQLRAVDGMTAPAADAVHAHFAAAAGTPSPGGPAERA